MEILDVKELLEKTVKSADSMILTSKRLERKEIKSADANAIANNYRSAGNLYLGVVQALEGSTLNIQRKVDPTELTPEDRDRLDKITKLLQKKPSKRK